MTVTQSDIYNDEIFARISPTVNANNNSVSIDATKYQGLYFREIDADTFKNFKYTHDGKNLIITYSYKYKDNNYNKTVTLTDYFANESGTKIKSTIKTLVYDGNTSYVEFPISNASIVDAEIVFVPKKNGSVTGTVFSDTINMEDALDAPLNKKNKGLTINGGKGNDDITGTMFNDTITGGIGINTYNYDFGAKSGQDTIKLTKGETLILNLKNGETVLDETDVSYAKIGNNLIITLDGAIPNNQLIIKNYFNANATVQIGDDKLSDYMSAADFKGLNIIGHGKIVGTQYNDIIQGSIGNDTITAKAGNDNISTNGGKDTVVETGIYGHDIIDSRFNENNVKVTVKVDSFDSNNISFNDDGDLIYTTDDNSDFTYNGFKTGDAADLWIQDKKKTYHIVNSSKSLDYSNNKYNNVIFLSGENSTYTGSKKGVNVVYSDGVNTFTYNGGNEIYIDNETTDDNYVATLTKSGTLFIDDKSGDDSLTLNNKTSDLSLFYNINLSGADSEDLVIYNKNAVSYQNLVKAYKNNSYSGAAVIDNYFSNGEIETIKYSYSDVSADIDMSGWRYYVETLVKDYLGEIKKESVEDVLLNGKNSQKSKLASIFKNATYNNYQIMKLTSDKYSDITIADENSILKIYGKDADNKDVLLYKVKDFLSETAAKSVSLLVVDDNGELMTLNINSQKQISYTLGNDNVITLDSDEKYSDISFVNDNNVLKIFDADDNLLYTVKDFVSETDNQKIILNVLDDNNKSMAINLDSLMNKEYNLGNDNVITLDSDEKYSDISFVNDNNVLKIFGADDNLLYTVKDFVSETDSQNIILNVLDDNNKSMAINLDSLMNKEYAMGNNNVITFDSNEKYSDISFVNDGNVLKIFGEDNKLLYTVKDFVSETDGQKIILNVLDDENKNMSINLDSLMNKEFNLTNNNQITFDENFSEEKIIEINNNSSNTFVFKNKAYADFYTKSSEVIAYNSGDPLIQKNGEDLVIGNIKVEDIDGKTSEIQIVDKNNETKNIIIGSGTINGTFESEIIIGSNSADTINTNGNNDLIYMGAGNDTLNVTSEQKGEATGKNTAKMTGIGGTTTIEDDLTCPAISVYDASGDDTYNTSFDYGLYIEDFGGNDTLNIKHNGESIMYFFDVVNPNKANENPILYTDLMICDKGALTTAITPIATQIAMAKIFGTPININMKEEMEKLQGKFGYAWVDDYYGDTQKIETVNLVDENNEVTKTFNLDYTDTNSDVSAIYQQVSGWLSTTSYKTAWDVLEEGSKTDMANLMMIYMGMNQ